MKYGFLFSLVSGLLAAVAFTHGGWYLLALWPSLSFAIVAVGYFRIGPAVYGKSRDGNLAITNQLLLLPYLIYLWSVWYAIRHVKREPAYDQLTTKRHRTLYITFSPGGLSCVSASDNSILSQDSTQPALEELPNGCSQC